MKYLVCLLLLASSLQAAETLHYKTATKPVTAKVGDVLLLDSSRYPVTRDFFGRKLKVTAEADRCLDLVGTSGEFGKSNEGKTSQVAVFLVREAGTTMITLELVDKDGKAAPYHTLTYKVQVDE